MTRSDTKSLEARVQIIEDRLDILNLLAGSAIGADIATDAFQAFVYADQAALDRGAGQQNTIGTLAIKRIFSGTAHIAGIEAGMAHFAGLPHVRVERDHAVATGYFQIVVPDPTAPEVALAGHGAARGLCVWRLAVNRWELARDTGGWKVMKRTIRAITDPEARALMEAGLLPGGADSP